MPDKTGGPDLNHPDHHAPTIARNARIGLWLFALYCVLYGGFMALNAFAHEKMAVPVVAGVNLAIVYGFGLIVAALVLAIIYMILVRPARPTRPEGRP